MSPLLDVQFCKPSEALLKAAGSQAPKAVGVAVVGVPRGGGSSGLQEATRALPRTRAGHLTMLHTPRSMRLGGKPCAPFACGLARGAPTPSGFGGWLVPASMRVAACSSFWSFLFLAPRFHTWPQLLRRMHLCDSKKKQGCGRSG